MGKIELPVDNDTRPKREAEDKRKRKRIPIEKKGSQPAVPRDNRQQGGGFNRDGQNRRPPQQGMVSTGWRQPL